MKKKKTRVAEFIPAVFFVVFALAPGCKTKTADRQPAEAAGEGGGEAVSLEDVTLNGAGASFPFPIYSKWASKFNKMTGMKLNYQSIGSGGGISQIKAKTVDFGASDAPMKEEELDDSGLVQFPMIMGGVVPVFNLEGIEAGKLKLSAGNLAEIYLGKIKKWNDAKIKEANEGVELPDKDITVVHRADGSGTTWIFTSYLCKVSPEWEEKVGTGKAVSWPAGVGGKGNEGVAANVQRISGSIGYVEFAYALQNEIPYVSLQNREGEFVQPTIETFQAAAASAAWEEAPGFYMVLANQPGKDSWPITGASFILLHEKQEDRNIAVAMLEFFDWCFEHGDEAARELHYVPIPDNVVTMVRKVWSERIQADGAKVWEM